MEASTPSHESNINYLKSPCETQTLTTPFFVCKWPWRWSSSSIPPSIFLFICLLVLSPHLTFLVSSQSVPIPISPSTSPSSLYNPTTNPKSIQLKIIIPIIVCALLITFLVVMGFLKFLRIRIRRKRSVVVVAGDGDGDCEQGRIEKCSFVESSVLRRFTWSEIERVTMNFSSVIGSGGFSTVYLAQFSDSCLGAVKIHSSSERLNRAYKQELDILLRLRHDNIVKLLGHCDDREEGVLVFEYVSNGSLQEKLHGGNGSSVLSWKTRMAIAFQLAEAIEYLHEQCDLQIVHGDIKASNILLDEMLNCKLCDFGSAKMGFSSTILPPSAAATTKTKQLMMGSLGYVDPHYMRTGIASKKNDVYSFGVIVLELITGMEAFCSEKGKMLTSIAGPMVAAEAVAEMVDPRLAGEFELEELKDMASISGLCLGVTPGLRPSASEILRTMREKIGSVSFLFSEGKKV